VLPDYQKVPNFRLLEFGRRDILRENREASNNRRQAIADELLFLGLYDEGTPELEKAEEEKRKKGEGEKSPAATNADYNYTLAVFYKRGEMAHRAVAFIEPLWRSVPADYQIELMPREQAELLYPAPYPDALVKYAAPRRVDPRYVLSIMRQESRYRADVKSNAAARGLMQFISTTSNQIARELGRENFRQDELYHPPTAVLFGSQYLANLYKMFPDQHAAVAASYNGGEDNMKRWLARSRSDAPDRYVPEIIFSQSKDYVYRVMANYRVYRAFYDENLRAK
jgi:soluble lytic murein transglycosylase